MLPFNLSFSLSHPLLQSYGIPGTTDLISKHPVTRVEMTPRQWQLSCSQQRSTETLFDQDGSAGPMCHPLPIFVFLWKPEVVSLPQRRLSSVFLCLLWNIHFYLVFFWGEWPGLVRWDFPEVGPLLQPRTPVISPGCSKNTSQVQAVYTGNLYRFWVPTQTSQPLRPFACDRDVSPSS